MKDNEVQPATTALQEILARPASVRTYAPPSSGGAWRATLLPALGHIDAPIRPYGYIGVGTTEREAIEDLLAREAADTWEADNARGR